MTPLSGSSPNNTLSPRTISDAATWRRVLLSNASTRSRQRRHRRDPLQLPGGAIRSAPSSSMVQQEKPTPSDFSDWGSRGLGGRPSGGALHRRFFSVAALLLCAATLGASAGSRWG